MITKSSEIKVGDKTYSATQTDYNSYQTQTSTINVGTNEYSAIQVVGVEELNTVLQALLGAWNMSVEGEVLGQLTFNSNYTVTGGVDGVQKFSIEGNDVIIYEPYDDTSPELIFEFNPDNPTEMHVKDSEIDVIVLQKVI